VLAAPASAGRPAAGGKGGKPRVVVAVVDTGINPYHEFFHAGGSLYKRSAPSGVTRQVLRELGIDKDHVIRLTRTGNFEADFKKDSAQFDNIKKGEPYWFEGTNVIGISFQDERRLRPDGNASPHGIGTSGAVLAANPDAIVVAVEGINNESEEWAFTHPAVDIVSTSYGPVTSIPTLNHLSFSYTGVVQNGKVHLGAAANDPTWASLDETSGPWWTVGIAGYQEGTTEGRQLMSANFPDFVGDFTQDLPYCRSCEKDTQSVSGTSFATPRSAGTFSKVLLEARRAARHRGGIVTKGVDLPLLVKGKLSFTNWEARRALEQAAYYPGVGDYQPGAEGTFDLTSVPVVDAAPWLQTGWGAITPDPEHGVIKEALALLGVKGKPDRSKSAEACEFMTANIAARHAYWDNAAVFGESFGTSADPYIYC
ncbi:MAG: S8 family serine peptidase, partial [Actinomycetota bacterium]